MKIGIDARLYSESGIGRYIRNLLNNIAKIDSENQYFVFLLQKDIPSVKLPKNFQIVEANFRWYGVTEQIRMPRLLAKYKLDLTHFPHFNVPIFFQGKFVITIHDLIHQKFHMRRATRLDPLTYKIKQFGYHKTFTFGLDQAKKVITVSNYVKEQIVNDCGVKNEKIIVTPEAAEDNIIQLNQFINLEHINTTLTKYGIKPPFIFYVGNAHPHKNVEGLIKAFLLLRKKYQYIQLVLAGHDHYFWERIKKENQHKDIIYTGYISDEELVALYKSAKAFVMPSFEEGFGIPLLEAMACGCPVVSSHNGSLPEVGGSAAIYFDPADPVNIAEKIELVLNVGKVSQGLIVKGEERYKQFSWRRLARETLTIYSSV